MGGGETKYSDMDFSELTKIIFSRVQKLEPNNVIKIVGCILLKEPGEQEMIQLAIGPDNTLLSKINEAKANLGMLSPKSSVSAQVQSIPDLPHQFGSYQYVPRPFSSPTNFHVASPYWDPQLASDQHAPIHNVDFVLRSYSDTAGEDYSFHNQSQFLNLEEQLEPVNPVGNYYYPDAAVGGGMTLRNGRRTQSLLELPTKACHYFIKGFCKHGSNCRYSHGKSTSDGYSQLFSPNANESASEDHGLTPGSLERLEMEIAELLRSRRGVPVSIAALPMLYFETYGRHLQAEGYLTESQRHGKAGFSLTKLLARLKNSIRLIDRPHGQHSVILAEDAPKYMECRNERNDPGAIASSHQIYLTFPADSTFTEEDVAEYFMNFGPVRDVRIPCQDKRMFGFVSFMYSDTVNTILLKRNPHYICGARVLVKPYREKSRIVDRTYMDKVKPVTYYPNQYHEIDPDLHAMPVQVDSSRLLKKQIFDEKDEMLELERKRFAEFNLGPKTFTQQPYFNYGIEEFKVSEGVDELPLTDHFSYTLDALNNGSTSDDKARQTSNSYSDQESAQIELPESPFASPPLGSSITAVI